MRRDPLGDAGGHRPCQPVEGFERRQVRGIGLVRRNDRYRSGAPNGDRGRRTDSLLHGGDLEHARPIDQEWKKRATVRRGAALIVIYVNKIADFRLREFSALIPRIKPEERGLNPVTS